MNKSNIISKRSRDSHKASPKNQSQSSKPESGFNPYDITAETAETAVLLLESQETEILCRTLRAITKFAEHEVQNRETLYNLKVLKYLLPHIDRAELNVKRFALKALALICQLPQGPCQVIADPSNLQKIANMLVQDEDVFVLEFASLVLAELTREPLGCDQMISANVLDSVFHRITTCDDPDVQNNCTQILSNLISDPGTASDVTSSQHFSWSPLLALLKSRYMQIQKLALSTVDQLISRYKDQAVQESFRASTGIRDLCDLFEAYEFRDIHVDVLQVMQHYAETEENACHVHRSGCLPRLLKYLGEALPSTRPHCLAVLTKMAHTPKGRDALFAADAHVVFCSQLQADAGVPADAGGLADAARGVGLMARLLPAADDMLATNIVETLFAILYDEAVPWSSRVECLRAVAALCALPAAAALVVEPTLFDVLRNVNRKFESSPLEAQHLALQCYLNLLDYECGLQAMIHANFIKELLGILKRADIPLRMKACSVLVGMMREARAREIFTECDGEMVVSECLRSPHVGLRAALCSLVCAAVTRRSADVYLGLGTVDYMFCNKRARYALPAWETALETIFHHHPSAKFGYMNMLDINDNTRDCFYVQKHPTKCFPTLASLRSSPSRLHPVLVADFDEEDSRSKEETGLNDALSPELSESCPVDMNLANYVRRLRTMFPSYQDQNPQFHGPNPSCPVSSTLLLRARVLGVFVGVQMCGLTQEMDCSMPSVDLHLADLMRELNSCVVSLGLVRCGGPLERAVLYKVLADRIALPCALYRSTTRAWCEVAVPDVRPEDSQREQLYPGGRLRANYVVDLTEEPGSLHPQHSEQARRIRGC